MKEVEELLKVESKYISCFSENDINNANSLLNNYVSRFGPCPVTDIFPYFCRRGLKKDLISISRLIHSTLNTVAKEYFNTPHSFPHLSAPTQHSDLIIKKNSLFNDSCPIIRVDCFVGQQQNQIKIIEINSAEPSAYGWNDLLMKGFLNHKEIKHFVDKFDPSFDFIVPNFLKTTKRLFSDYCVRKKISDSHSPKICLYMPKTSTVYFDFRSLKELLLENNTNVDLLDPSDFFNDSSAIHIRDSIEDIFSNQKIIAPEMFDAINKQTHFIINPLSAILTDQKSLLPYIDSLLPILKSYHLCRDMDSYILDNIKKNKDSWVIKPSNGYGGFDVFIGRSVSIETWLSLIESILISNDSYIVQQYEQPDIYFNRRTSKKLFSNFNFWIIGGEYAGAFVRTSEVEPINYHQGGALIPVLFI